MLCFPDMEIDKQAGIPSLLEKETMDALDLTGLRVFCEIVDAGSFTRAADRLGMAPPMVSKHLARLERALAARLLNRTSRTMSLTEAGTLFHEQARQALDALDAGVAAVGQSIGQPRGELKVSAPAWLATPRFAGLVADYREACPEVRLDIHLDNRMVDLVAEGFDLALRMKNDPAQNLVSRPLCRVSFHCVATPAYLRRHAARGQGEALAPVEMILPNYMPFGRPKMPAEAMDIALAHPVAMRSSDATLSYHTVLAGLGAAFLPDWMVAEDLAGGRLARVDIGGDPFIGQLHAVYPSRRHLPPKLRSFIDFLVLRLGT